MTYTITSHDEARNFNLLLASRVERAMRPQEFPAAANHIPLLSVAKRRIEIAMEQFYAAHGKRHQAPLAIADLEYVPGAALSLETVNERLHEIRKAGAV